MLAGHTSQLMNGVSHGTVAQPRHECNALMQEDKHSFSNATDH